MAIYPSTAVELVRDAAAARRVIEALEEAGIPETSISTLETSAGGSVGATRPVPPGAESDRSFGGAGGGLHTDDAPPPDLVDEFVRLGLSEHDARAHADAVQRGATALIIRLIDSDQSDCAHRVLERHRSGGMPG